MKIKRKVNFFFLFLPLATTSKYIEIQVFYALSAGDHFCGRRRLRIITFSQKEKA
jgi:hypothetical protein